MVETTADKEAVVRVTRRTMFTGIGTLVGAHVAAACSAAGERSDALITTTVNPPERTWRMPAEDAPHECTWMCWPSAAEVWGDDLVDVQDTIVDIALAIAEFEPVRMIARPSEVGALKNLLGRDVEIVEGPVDDLWARDTLPNFVITDTGEPMATHARFNGWGGKQISSGDTQLAALAAQLLGVGLYDSGLVGEGGGLEVDGIGTVLAAESCWVNDNRNPGRSRDDIEQAILRMLGAQRMIWVPGLSGFDITDGHIDTLARFVGTDRILVDRPAVDDPGDPWVAVAARTKADVAAATTLDGEPYKVDEITQPLNVRGGGDDFLSTYMNFYVCNGAVIAPQFGDDTADNAAREQLADLFPDREIVLLDIDPLAAGGGGIHCATQQQPAVA